MKPKTKLLLAALALAVLVSAGFARQSPPSWEYQAVTYTVGDDKHATSFLNLSGLAGWELVAVESRGRERVYFFKRRKP